MFKLCIMRAPVILIFLVPTLSIANVSFEQPKPSADAVSVVITPQSLIKEMDDIQTTKIQMMKEAAAAAEQTQKKINNPQPASPVLALPSQKVPAPVLTSPPEKMPPAEPVAIPVQKPIAPATASVEDKSSSAEVYTGFISGQSSQESDNGKNTGGWHVDY